MQSFFSSLTVTIIIISVIFPGILTESTSQTEWDTTTGCGIKEGNSYKIPTTPSECTRDHLDSYYSCCYVTLVKDLDDTTTNICAAFETMHEITKENARNYYKNKGFTASNIVCPIVSQIPNTCGLAGVVSPIDVKDCNRISIPETHCCLIKANKNNIEHQACRRIDEFPNKDTTNETIIAEMTKLQASIIGIDCSGLWFDINIKMSSLLIIMIIAIVR